MIVTMILVQHNKRTQVVSFPGHQIGESVPAQPTQIFLMCAIRVHLSIDDVVAERKIQTLKASFFFFFFRAPARPRRTRLYDHKKEKDKISESEDRCSIQHINFLKNEFIAAECHTTSTAASVILLRPHCE